MALDPSKITELVEQQIDALEGIYDDECEIGDVVVIVEVRGPHGSHARMRTTESRCHVNIGLLRMAEHSTLSGRG